ncbi:phosphopantetheine-binding protein [Streptomyces sp. NPDC057386]|uniref:phosphopantetheine-binding protein n=1 Tax=unclassified Streptomyces TaxID=2593676 RepID=UPI0036368D70
MPASTAIPQRFQDLIRPFLPYADAGELDAGRELAALGLDSMGVVQLLAALEEGYDLEFPDDALNQDTFATVGSLWQTVAGVLSDDQHGDD